MAKRGDTLKIGDLVKITRPSVGVPANTLGVVLDITFADSGFRYFKIKMFGPPSYGFDHRTPRRYLGRDLEIVSESG